MSILILGNCFPDFASFRLVIIKLKTIKIDFPMLNPCLGYCPVLSPHKEDHLIFQGHAICDPLRGQII
jgi:hypothetical protein